MPGLQGHAFDSVKGGKRADKQMKQLPKRTRTALLVLGILFVGAIVLFWNREPRARGHSLSTWLKAYGEIGTELSSEDAHAAINEIGERAIPTLLEKIQASDPAWKEPLHQLNSKMRWLPVRSRYWAQEEQQEAVRGFRCLGPKARPAIPQLAKLLYDTNSTDAAGSALAAIGDEALPVLRAALTNGTNPVAQLVAMNATSGSNWAVAVLPEMRMLKTHTNEQVAISAIVQLMHHGAKGEVEAEALNVLQSGRSRSRASIVGSLTWAGVDPQKAAPVLVPLLNDANLFVRRAATNVLRQIDPVTAASVGIETNMNILRSRSPAVE